MQAPDKGWVTAVKGVKRGLVPTTHLGYPKQGSAGAASAPLASKGSPVATDLKPGERRAVAEWNYDPVVRMPPTLIAREVWRSAGYCGLVSFPRLTCGAQGEDELDMVQGQVIKVTAKGQDEGWVVAENRAGRSGLVPETHIRYS